MIITVNYFKKASAPVRDCGAENLLSSMTEDLVQEKKIKDKILQVQTVINDGFDEIIDLAIDDSNKAEDVSSSVQFEIDDSDIEGGNITNFCS